MVIGMRNSHKFHISKRELLVSIVIAAVMLVIGFIISSSIEDSLLLKHQEYNLALQINNDRDMFEHGMRTNIGNAFVYGQLKCLDPVTYDEIGGEYSYVKKVKEKYTRHTRTVTRTKTVNGKTTTYTETEHYYTWDAVSSCSKQSTKISFLDVEFDYGAIDFPYTYCVATIKESSKIRYVYYGAPAEATGTLYAKLENDTISNTSFYANMDIAATLKHFTSSASLVIFWVVWSAFIILFVFVFLYLDNYWLEDRRGRH
jgi:hypothetical protein